MIRLYRFKRVAASALIAFSATTAIADPLIGTITAVETNLEGRVGVAMRDLTTGKEWTYRADERFPMSSTFKALLCGAVLSEVVRFV